MGQLIHVSSWVNYVSRSVDYLKVVSGKTRLSPAAARFASEKPKAWEYLLFLQICREGVEDLGPQLEEYDFVAGVSLVTLGERKALFDGDDRQWLIDEMSAQIAIARSVLDLFQIVLPRAFGDRGEEGDVEEIVTAGRSFADILEQMLEWTMEMRSTQLVAPLDEIRIQAVEIFEPAIESMRTYPLRRTREALEVIESGSGPIDLSLEFVLKNVDSVLAKLEEVNSDYAPEQDHASVTMKPSQSQISDVHTTYTARGLPRYEVEIRHDGLKKYQTFKGDNPHMVREKAIAKMKAWDEMWDKQVAKEDRQANIANKKDLAQERTAEAAQTLTDLENILAYTLGIDDRVDWEQIKDHAPFAEAKPSREPLPPEIPELRIPREPKELDPDYQPKIGFLDKIVAGRRQKKELDAKVLFKADHDSWANEKEVLTATNELAVEKRQRRVDAMNGRHQAAVQQWEDQRRAYEADRAERNAEVDKRRAAYESGADPQAVEEYCDIVLSLSQYPDYFPQTYEIEYNPANKTVIVDYRLPAKEDLPTLKEVRYVQSRHGLDEKHVTDAQLNTLYDSVVYQIGLRTIHELFEADTVSALDSIVFNGIVEYVDRAMGKDTKACIMSVQTTKEQFLDIHLALVEPKSCFKNLGGVGSSKLYSMTPVKPIQRVSREDSRLVEGREVAIQEGENLAVMDWEDFEHLIRELFERRFARDGGEVRVTQASRDGGVDAIAFDPDPIRGGKIVIQAKRYTNTVGVDAVRDLYGTVQHEGAMLGILVTTSDYGPDAYKFAEGKPINLIAGGELLYMLGELGHKARIDLKEAKEIQASRR